MLIKINKKIKLIKEKKEVNVEEQNKEELDILLIKLFNGENIIQELLMIKINKMELNIH